MKYPNIVVLILSFVFFLSCSTFSGRKIVPLVLNGTKTFYYPTSESAKPTDDILDYLYSASYHLKDNPSVRINIVGHSDNSGSYDEDVNRAIKRAEKCYFYLVELGIDKFRIMFSGLGNMRPVSQENTEEARAKNRRVEINFVIPE